MVGIGAENGLYPSSRTMLSTSEFRLLRHKPSVLEARVSAGESYTACFQGRTLRVSSTPVSIPRKSMS
jgi:hypothetical protein